MYEACSTTARRGALDWQKKFKDALKPVFNDLYDSVKDGSETKRSLEFNSRPDYREAFEKEVDEIRNLEIWRAGKVSSFPFPPLLHPVSGVFDFFRFANLSCFPRTGRPQPPPGECEINEVWGLIVWGFGSSSVFVFGSSRLRKLRGCFSKKIYKHLSLPCCTYPPLLREGPGPLNVLNRMPLSRKSWFIASKTNSHC